MKGLGEQGVFDVLAPLDHLAVTVSPMIEATLQGRVGITESRV